MLKKTVLVIISLMIAPFAFSGAANAGNTGADYSEIMALQSKEADNLYLLDVRTPGEYAQGHIPGSVLIPMKQIQGSLGRIPRDKKVIVICASGARSGAVSDFLSRQGYPWVKNYSGGIMDWARRGLPIAR